MYNCIIFIFNLLIFVYFGIFLCHYRRFSVTTNPNIRKEDIIEGHERTKEEGSQRRRTRRLRRQLESVAAGTIVTGYVDRIISEGILVKITSLGSLEVNGLIRKVDLPEQFQVPPGMKESYQTQMLQQDFIPGREITCGVTQVHPNPDDSLVYNVKLMFEDFDGPPVDDVDVTDRFETMSQKERDAVVHNKKFAMTESDDRDTNKEYDDNDDDDTDFEDAFGDYEEEVKNVYEELVANSADGTVLASQQGEKLLKVRDFYDWEPIQDMIKEKSITKNDIDEAIRSVGASKTGTLSLEQFEQVVSELQEQVNESDQGEDTEDEEEMQSKVNKNMRDQDEDDGWGEEAEESNISLTASRTPNNDNEDQDDLNDTDLEDEDDSESTMTAEEDFELAVQDAFDELKSADGRVSVADLKEWKDIKAILDVGAIDMEALDAVIDEVLQQNDKNKKSKKAETMDVAQFKAVMIVLDEIADLSSVDLDEQHQEDEDDMDDERDSRNSQSHVSEGKDQPEQEEGDYDDDDTDFEDAFGDYEEEVKNVYEELVANSADGTVLASQQGEKLLKVRDFYDWEPIQDMIKEKSITKNDIDEAIRSVGASKTGTLSLEQFEQVVSELQEQVNESDQGEDTEDEEEMQSKVNKNMRDQDEDDGWGEEAEESNISLTASRTPNNDNEDQDDLNDTDLEDEDDSESTMTAEEDFELAVQDAFDELKSADGRVSVADLKEWKDIKAILDVGAIDMEALDAVIDEVLQQNDKNKKSKKAETMDVAQFKAVMIVLDEIADLSSVDLDEQHQEDEDDMDDERDSRNSQSHVSEGKDQPEQGEGDYDDDDDDDTITEEEYARELEEQVQGVFEELKNTKGKVPVKAFLAYEGIRALVDEGVIEESTIKSMLTDVGASLKGELNFDQLSKVMARIDRQINGLDDDADEPDDDSSQSRVSEGKEQPEQGEGDYDDTGEPDDDEAGGGDSNERVHQLTQSVDEREAHRTVQESNTPTYNNDNNHNGEEEDDELSEKELDEMAKSVFNELLPRGKKTIPFKVFMKWPGITNEISTGMIKENEVLHVLKSVDIKHREELDFDQFLQVMDEIEEIITERGEHDQMDTSTIDNNEEEEEEEGSVSEWGASSQIADGVQARSKGFGSTATGTALSGKETSKHAEIEIQELTQEIYNNLKGKVWNTIVVVCLYMTNNTPT